MRLQNKKLQLPLAYFLSLFITLVVYITGGTRGAVINFMHIPIILASTTKGRSRGLIHAAFSGLLVGPFMPLNVRTEELQSPINWMIRTFLFLIVSFTITFIMENFDREYERNQAFQKEMLESHLATIYALVKVSESRDDDTGAHLDRVSKLSRTLTEKLREEKTFADVITEHYIDHLAKASPLHDIGKVGIPDQILLKPGKLTESEFKIIKQHPIIGSRILDDVYREYPRNKFLQIGYEVVRYHHEKYDGTGYPDQLKGEAIPLSARIMAIVDVYDSLRSKRVYKDAFSHEQCIEIIKNERGKHFDPRIVDVFLQYEKDFDRLYLQTMKNMHVKENEPIQS